MALTDAQRLQRQRYIGSSDAPAIVGLDPRRNAGDVWLEKMGRLMPQADPGDPTRDTENDPRVLGAMLEGPLVAWAAQRLGAMAITDEMWIALDGRRCANLDGRVTDGSETVVIEGKSAGLMGLPEYADAFGEPGTDEVPEHVHIQVHHQFAVLAEQPGLPPCRLALVPCFIGRRGFVLYRVPYDLELGGLLVEAEAKFIRDHLDTGRPPDATPSFDVLKRVRRTETTSPTPIAARVIACWEYVKQQRGCWEKVEAAMKAKVLQGLGDHEAAEIDDGSGIVTYKGSERKAYTVAATHVRRLTHRKHKGHQPGPGVRGESIAGLEEIRDLLGADAAPPAIRQLLGE